MRYFRIVYPFYVNLEQTLPRCCTYVRLHPRKLHICVAEEGFMERKVSGRRKGAVSPRNERREEEEVFDYPGLEDESDESGPVSRDAHNALRKGS